MELEIEHWLMFLLFGFAIILLSYITFVDTDIKSGWIKSSKSLPSKRGEYVVLLEISYTDPKTKKHTTTHIPWKANYVEGLIVWKISDYNKMPPSADVRVAYWMDYPYAIKSQRKKNGN